MSLGAIIGLAVSAVVAAAAFIVRCHGKKDLQEHPDSKKAKRTARMGFWIMVIAIWFFAATIMNYLSGGSRGLQLELELFAPRTALFGVSVSQSTILTWIILAVVLVLGLLFRFVCVPRFTENPRGLQNVMELAVESMDHFCRGVVGPLADALSPYMFSVAILLIGCAATELFGQRPPTADIVMNLSLSLITLVLINAFGIKTKKLRGRIKALASPSPVIMPMKILSDVAVPVSLACRLFGNMLGGMIVMDLLKSALGGYSMGLTSLAGIYFNLFHPLIQTYIFIILSLTFINEAAE